MDKLQNQAAAAVADKPAMRDGAARLTRTQLIGLLNEDLAREYQAIIAFAQPYCQQQSRMAPLPRSECATTWERKYGFLFSVTFTEGAEGGSLLGAEVAPS